VRHETEIRLAEEVEKGKGQNEILKLNQETMMRKN
jgi:hypothetical protein